MSEDIGPKLIEEGFDLPSLIEELRPNYELLKEAGIELDSDVFKILVKVEID